VSPSEADLRAALREGEGDGVDPHDIIFAVRQARARRRTVLLSAAAAVVFVGGAAAGVSALVNAGSPNGSGTNSVVGASENAAAASGPHRAPQASANQAHNPPLEPGFDISTACAKPAAASPTGSGSSADRSGQLLPGPVQRFIVCTYANFAGPQSTASAQPVVVTGPAASSLARSLRTATATAIPPRCPMVASTGNIALRLIPVAPGNRRLPPLIATVGLPACASNVSNGVIIRYGWRLPPDVRALLHLGTVENGPIQLTPVHQHPIGSPPR
jgi:hypothetical protein